MGDRIGQAGHAGDHRLAEHWAYGLDITGPLRVEFPDTGRLRHVAWLAHRTLPYAMTLAGEFCRVAAQRATRISGEFARPTPTCAFGTCIARQRHGTIKVAGPGMPLEQGGVNTARWRPGWRPL
jgi:hypothetical protein